MTNPLERYNHLSKDVVLFETLLGNFAKCLVSLNFCKHQSSWMKFSENFDYFLWFFATEWNYDHRNNKTVCSPNNICFLSIDTFLLSYLLYFFIYYVHLGLPFSSIPFEYLMYFLISLRESNGTRFNISLA